MAGGSKVRRMATAWLFIALLLSERAIAIRVSDLEDQDAGEELQERGKSCEELQQDMVEVIDWNARHLHPLCEADLCDFSILDVKNVITGQQMITSVASAADRKKCLPEVMGLPEVQASLHNVLSIVPKVLRASQPQEAQSQAAGARLQEAFSQLVAFQEGTLALAGWMTDRRLLLTSDIQGNCPAPCRHCDYHGTGGFAFRCLLTRRDKDRTPELDERHGLACAAPRRRWFRWFPFLRHCIVADWKELAIQHEHVSAMLACATATIFMGLSGELTAPRRREMHGVCLQVEQGNNIASDVKRDYDAKVKVRDGIVSDSLLHVYGVIHVAGLASGLAGLRAASRGNERPALFEVGKEGAGKTKLAPQDFFAAFARVLADEGITLGEADRAMYANPDIVRRAEVLHRLEVCQDAYKLKVQNALAEGAKPLTVRAMTSLQGSHEKSQNSDYSLKVKKAIAGGEKPLTALMKIAHLQITNEPCSCCMQNCEPLPNLHCCVGCQLYPLDTNVCRRFLAEWKWSASMIFLTTFGSMAVLIPFNDDSLLPWVATMWAVVLVNVYYWTWQSWVGSMPLTNRIAENIDRCMRAVNISGKAA